MTRFSRHLKIPNIGLENQDSLNYLSKHASVLQRAILRAQTISLGSDAQSHKNESTESKSSPTLRHVVVKKNNQSMAFRNGSPLVFSGSIDSIFQVRSQFMTSETDIDISNHIPIGSLVSVRVNNEKEKFSSSGKGTRGKKDQFDKQNNYIMNESDKTIYTYDDTSGKLSLCENNSREIITSLSNSKLIGYGVYNPTSMYRVRILCHETSHPGLFQQVKRIMTKKDDNLKDNLEGSALESILKSKIHDAILARIGLNLPSRSTDTYRLLNGEGDGLSGLVIDIIGGQVAVIMSSAAWCEIHKECILQVVTNILCNEHPTYSSQIVSNPNHTLKVVWRNTESRLKQDGYEISSNHSNGMDDSKNVDDTCIIATENGVKYKTFPYDLTSQKTSFYCDQRENRLNIAHLCQKKRVLDLCCYNGGFALNSVIHGGASFCMGVDSSPIAISAARENAELNDIQDDRIQFIQDDIEQFMKKAADGGQEYDVIVLDPPKLAPSLNGIERAARKYHSLNRDAMKLINSKEGGMLLTCTCSGAMTQKDGGQYFLQTLKGAALSAGRQITLLRVSGAAPCHTQCPASFPAGAYLTAALLYVTPKMN
jgi:23S rRNA G2069 N7-methylase RlmK/C1962 C5-methylase RlmI